MYIWEFASICECKLNSAFCFWPPPLASDVVVGTLSLLPKVGKPYISSIGGDPGEWQIKDNLPLKCIFPSGCPYESYLWNHPLGPTCQWVESPSGPGDLCSCSHQPYALPMRPLLLQTSVGTLSWISSLEHGVFLHSEDQPSALWFP